MTGSPAFHLFRFPIHIRPGFVMFMVLVVVVNGSELGLWIAGSAAVLTLLHELGHAFAARATGARAEIALDFLAGYASFVPSRPLTRWERAGISIAGPAVQIGVSVAVLLLMRVNPIDGDSYRRSAAALAIWWTGPMMGLFNLVPVLPLDGGHIVLAGLDAVLPRHSKKVMLWFSIGLTGLMGAYLFAHPRYQVVAYFVLFPLLVQLQMLFAAPPTARVLSSAAAGEAEAWLSGDLSKIPDGLVPSPWFRAGQQLQQGHPDVARAIIEADFTEQSSPNWWPPEFAPRSRLAPLLELFPDTMPTGRSYSEHALANILLRMGAYDDAARYAAGTFSRHRSTTAAAIVGRAASALGDVDTAFGWLGAAIDADTDPDGLLRTLESAPELEAVRGDERFHALRQRLDA